MNILQLFVATSATLFIFGGGVASAGEPKKDTGAMACVNDKWDVKEPEKGHKLVDAAMRCVLIPDDARRTDDQPGLRGKLRIYA